MVYKTSIHIRIAAMILLLFICGCASFGKLRIQSDRDDGVDIGYLIAHSNDYTIYYSGYDLNNASGILFDPKYDSRTITVSDAWKKIEGVETVSQVVKWVDFPDRDYIPTLYRILGPDNTFFGYMFTGWSWAVIKAINPNTLYIYELEIPPHYVDPPFERDD